MYYRMEACDDNSYPHYGWEGIFSYLDPWDTETFAERISVPKTIQNGNTCTRSWFTEKGWYDFRKLLFNACKKHCVEWNYPAIKVRVIATDAIPEKDVLETDDLQIVESFKEKDNVYYFPVNIQEERIRNDK